MVRGECELDCVYLFINGAPEEDMNVSLSLTSISFPVNFSLSCYRKLVLYRTASCFGKRLSLFVNCTVVHLFVEAYRKWCSVNIWLQ